MSRSRIRVLAGMVLLPAYLVAGNYCLIAETFAHGCMGAGESRRTCVASPRVSGNAHDVGTDCSEPAARHPSDHDRAGANRLAPCCDLVASALVPNAAKAVATPEVSRFIAATPRIAGAPVLLALGEALILSAGSPPTRATSAQHSRAPPLA
jgi:hypothetical protein